MICYALVLCLKNTSAAFLGYIKVSSSAPWRITSSTWVTPRKICTGFPRLNSLLSGDMCGLPTKIYSTKTYRELVARIALEMNLDLVMSSTISQIRALTKRSCTSCQMYAHSWWYRTQCPYMQCCDEPSRYQYSTTNSTWLSSALRESSYCDSRPTNMNLVTL